MKSGVYEFTTEIHLQFENKYVFSYRKKNYNIKRKCPQHLKNFDEKSLEILYDHDEAVFKHMVNALFKKTLCENFW
jgi:hypothetical protein